MERKVTIIAPSAIVEAARAACAECPGGDGMFVPAAGPTADGPATHYMNSGSMGEAIIAAAEAAGCIVSADDWPVALAALGLVLLP